MYVLALSDYKQMFKACCCRGLQPRPPIRPTNSSFFCYKTNLATLFLNPYHHIRNNSGKSACSDARREDAL